jgi:hypothetical protein
MLKIPEVPVFVNVILLVLIVHLLLIYVPQQISKYFSKDEQFENKDDIEIHEIEHNDDDSETMSEIIGNLDDDKDEMELISFLEANELPQYETAQPVDESVDNKNTPNFENNVLDYRNHYQINAPTELPNQTYYEFGMKNQNLKEMQPSSNFNKQQNPGLSPEIERLQPNEWNYHNEMVMNGGDFNNKGLVGYQTFNDEYAMYGMKSTLTQDCPKPNKCYREGTYPDDLREGLGTEGRQKIEYNI